MYLKVYKTRKSGCYAPFISSLGPTGPEKPLFILCHNVCSPPFVTKTCISRFIKKTFIPPFITKTFIPQFVTKRFVPPFTTKTFVPSFVTKTFVPPFSITKFAFRHKVSCLSQSFLSVIKSWCYQSFCGFPCSGFCW